MKTKIKVIKEWGREVYRKIRWHKDAEFWMYFALSCMVLTMIVLVALDVF